MAVTTYENSVETSVVSPRYDWSILNDKQDPLGHFEGLLLATKAVEFVCHVDGKKSELPTDITELRVQLSGRLAPSESDSLRELAVAELFLVAECVERLAGQPHKLLGYAKDLNHFAGYVEIARLYDGRLAGILPGVVQQNDTAEYAI